MLKHTLYPAKGNRRRFMNIYFENMHKRTYLCTANESIDMNQLQTTYSIHHLTSGNTPLCNHFIVHVHWFSGFV